MIPRSGYVFAYILSRHSRNQGELKTIRNFPPAPSMPERPDPKAKVDAVKSHMFFPLGIVKRTRTFPPLSIPRSWHSGKDYHRRQLTKQLIQHAIERVRLANFNEVTSVLFNLLQISDEICLSRFDDLGLLDEFPAEVEDREKRDL
jgi:hypothetical protein